MAIHPTSRLYLDDGYTFLRVSPEHAISGHWLTEHAADLYTAWQAEPDPALRDHIATLIDQRFTDLVELPPNATTARMHARPVVAAPIHRYEVVLFVMIEHYETRLIAEDSTGRDNPDRRSIDAYITSHQLTDTNDVRDLELRDWAETGAPVLYASWQRAVVADGDLRAATAPMQAIATARGWVDTLTTVHPALTDPEDLPALAAALQRAELAGYPVRDRLPHLAKQQPLPPRHAGRELHHRLVAECDAALPAIPTRAQIALALEPRPPRPDYAQGPHLRCVPTPNR